MPFQIQEYNHLDNRLQSQWQSLWDASSCAHFFNSPQWFLACTKVFPSGSYRLVAVYGNGELAAILPLCIERRFGIKTLVCPGGKHLSKSGLLVKENSPAILRTIVSHLSQSGNFYLSQVSAETAELASRGARGVAKIKSSINPYIPLTEDPFSLLSKKQRSKLFAKIKKNKNFLIFKSFKGDREGLDFAFAIEKTSSKRERGMVTFAGDGDRQFFRQLLAEFGERITVDVLFYNGAPMVFSINFIYKKIYHAFKTDYDKNYRRLSPGKLMLYYILSGLKKSDFEIFDFSLGMNILKKEFTPFFYTQFDVYFANSALVKFWWDVSVALSVLKTRLYENETLYLNYLRVKKLYGKARAGA